MTYLAKHYLTADTPTTSDRDRDRPKKKRKKQRDASSKASADDGLIIADDDLPDLRGQGEDHREEDEDLDSPYAYAASGAIKRERRTTKANWKTIGKPTPADGDQSDADAILASAAAEREARANAVDEMDAPVVEGGVHVEDSGAPRMESGARSGLQTAAQTAALIEEQRRNREKDAASLKKKKKGEHDPEQETIYRDASGRIINVAMKRAEARRAAEEAAKQEAAAKEALGGDVQRREREARKAALEEAKYMPIARRADDEELNMELKAQMRWNDPAAEFLTKPSGGRTTARSSTSTVKKTYRGAFAPNRYGIRPGHRWDGVDRGNGFEKEWFAARNKQSMKESLEYNWMMDE
ncbi:Pre-mRNA-splicing factor cwc26 [Ascosphaera atra]|nr:Pre-mRNA-splicing factor cwc26 [Ascosphaera atra]